MRLLDLFSGIGGFSLGLERAGFETVAFCEIDPFCQKVLKKHWPDVPIFNDVRKLYRFADEYELCELCEKPKCDLCGAHFFECDCVGCSEFDDEIGSIDVISAGFPCTDLSIAGTGRGLDGENSALWYEVARIASGLRPQYIILENSTELLRPEWMGRICGTLAGIGYDAEWHVIPACAFGSFHRRERLFIVAYPSGTGRQKRELPALTSEAEQWVYSFDTLKDGLFWPDDCPPILREGAKVPRRLDRIRALGNSINPDIAEFIGRSIMRREILHAAQGGDY